MSHTDSFDEPPDDNEAFANLDESLDDEDGLRPGAGPEGARDLDYELVVDRLELEEAGANLDDPERIALLDGGMDDPDGSGPPPPADDEAGWDVDPAQHDRAGSAGDDIGADGDAVAETELIDAPELEDGDDDAGVDIEAIPEGATGLERGR